MFIREFSQDEINRVLKDLLNRIDTVQKPYTAGVFEPKHFVLPNTPNNPQKGTIAVDIDAGQLKVWNGESWDTYTKD